MSTRKKAIVKKATAPKKDKPKDSRRRSVVGIDNDQYDAMAKRKKTTKLSIAKQVKAFVAAGLKK